MSTFSDFHDAFVRFNSTPHVPKAWMEDPYEMLSSLGMDYKETPASVTYDTLRAMAENNTVVAAVHETIASIIVNFCRRPKNKYDIGFRVKHKELPEEAYTPEIRARARELENWILQCGQDPDMRRHNMAQLMRMWVCDNLTYDQLTAEITLRQDGRPYSLHYVPGYTIRLAPSLMKRGTPPDLLQQLGNAQYVQVIDGLIKTMWSEHMFVWMVSRPRTHLHGFGYGTSPLETLITTVTSHLWAEQWNANQFSQGSTIRGVINFKGNPGKEKLEDFRRQWMMQAAGVWNAHKQVVMNAEGVDFVPLNFSNTEMGYNQWITYLVQVICAIYKVSPDVCGFDLKHVGGGRGSIGKSGSAADKLEFSKDKFLRPFMQSIENIYNSPKILGALDPDYEFQWYGLDQKDEEKQIELLQRQLQTYMTMNEVRAKDGLPSVPHGDVPMNPVYTGYAAQKEMLAQQEEQQKQAEMMQQQAMQGEPTGEVDEEEDLDQLEAEVEQLEEELEKSLYKGVKLTSYNKLIKKYYDLSEI